MKLHSLYDAGTKDILVYYTTDDGLHGCVTEIDLQHYIDTDDQYNDYRQVVENLLSWITSNYLAEKKSQDGRST